eukprot:2076333-Amphidinium_carterae.1
MLTKGFLAPRLNPLHGQHHLCHHCSRGRKTAVSAHRAPTLRHSRAMLKGSDRVARPCFLPEDYHPTVLDHRPVENNSSIFPMF